MTTLPRIRAAFGVERKDVPGVLTRALTMHDAMNADPATYLAPTPDLPTFLALIQSCASAQQHVRTRTVGAAATRDVQRDLLWSAMESERLYVQSLADATRGRAVALIQNAGLLVGGSPAHGKAVLTLRHGHDPGSVICDANVGLLVRTAGLKPRGNRFFNWEYATNGGEVFQTAPSTSSGKMTLHGLTPLTVVGVQVNVNGSEGPGPWSQVATLLVL